MDRGWFPIFRKIFDSDVWGHPAARIVWIYVLGSVAHSSKKLTARYQCVTLQPGQMLTSRAVIAARCRLSERETRTAIKFLISTNRITVESTKRFTIITVVNWNLYRDAQMGSVQQNDQQNDQQVTNRRPTGDHIQKQERSSEGVDRKDSGNGVERAFKDFLAGLSKEKSLAVETAALLRQSGAWSEGEAIAHLSLLTADELEQARPFIFQKAVT